MAASEDRLDRLVRLLGGWPDHFGDEQKNHGRSILSVLVRDRVLDEAVFGIVVRYAVHRAAFDELSAGIADEEFKPTASSYLSGPEQSRAYHENRLLIIERELLATPYARAKGGLSAQTSFMEELDKVPDDQVEGGARKVTPFRPMIKKGRA